MSCGITWIKSPRVWGALGLDRLIAEAGFDEAGRADPRVVGGDGTGFAGDLFEGDGFTAIAFDGDHGIEVPVGEQLAGHGPEAGTEEAVEGGGRATPLDMAQRGDAGFDAGERLQFAGDAVGDRFLDEVEAVIAGLLD